MLISIHSKSKYMSYIIISHQIIEENLISQQKKKATGTGSYKVQTYKTRTNLHFKNLNLLNSADKPTPTTNFKRWKYEISLGYKIKNDWKSEGSGSTKMDKVIFFLQFFTSGSKTPLYKARIHLCWKITVNLASMSEREIQAL